jgi:hypothetical protein
MISDLFCSLNLKLLVIRLAIPFMTGCQGQVTPLRGHALIEIDKTGYCAERPHGSGKN